MIKLENTHVFRYSQCFVISQISYLGKIVSKACIEQAQAVGDLMKLFENGGFLRDCNGLNSLDSIKELAKILKIPEFKFQIKNELITDVCRNSKT